MTNCHSVRQNVASGGAAGRGLLIPMVRTVEALVSQTNYRTTKRWRCAAHLPRYHRTGGSSVTGIARKQ